MKFRKAIISLGILTAVLPFLGFPPEWKDIFFVLIGLTTAVLGYLLSPAARKRWLRHSSRDSTPARDEAERVLNDHEDTEHPSGNHLA